MKVLLDALAQQELADALAYYVEHANLEVAERLLDEFERTAALLCAHPDLGTPVEHAFRAQPLRRFPYTLIYKPKGEDLLVFAFAHQRRKPAYWLDR